MLDVFGVTDRGVREINEDCLQVDADLGVFVVADGMGGHNAGEVASRMAVDTIRAFLERTSREDEFTWPFGLDPALSYDANRLLTAIKLANRRVFRVSEERDEYTGMGTTVVAALIGDDRLAFAGVGDSRIYSFIGGQLTQLTHDDSWLARLAAEPGIDDRALATHPMRHVLTAAVGAREQADVELAEATLHDGECLLLCSDGLHGTLDDNAIAQVLAGSSNAESAARTLVEDALAQGSKDNISALVVRYRKCTDLANDRWSDRQAPAGGER